MQIFKFAGIASLVGIQVVAMPTLEATTDIISDAFTKRGLTGCASTSHLTIDPHCVQFGAGVFCAFSSEEVIAHAATNPGQVTSLQPECHAVDSGVVCAYHACEAKGTKRSAANENYWILGSTDKADKAERNIEGDIYWHVEDKTKRSTANDNYWIWAGAEKSKRESTDLVATLSTHCAQTPDGILCAYSPSDVASYEAVGAAEGGSLNDHCAVNGLGGVVCAYHLCE